MFDKILSSGLPFWLTPIAVWVVVIGALLIRAGLNDEYRQALLTKLGLMLALVYPTLVFAEWIRWQQWERVMPSSLWGAEPEVITEMLPDGTLIFTYLWPEYVPYDMFFLDIIPTNTLPT